ncbi:hypothetical protein EB73_34130 [Mycobacterium sp. SWH-M3]|nr:hypothetical protein EB73_34130 [Mycobacterium sp. SWH-M3]
MDVATYRDNLRRLAEMSTSDELQHMVHTAVARDGEDGVGPVHAAPIHDMVCAQLCDPVQFVRTARHDDLGAVHLRDLDSEQRDAAGAFDQHDVTGPHVPTFHQREPRREPSHRQRAGLRCRQGPRRPDNPVLR